MPAIFSVVADLKKVFEAARQRRRIGRRTLLFVDEIHRFNRAQQDGLLPYVEDGTVVLVGATTENPSFELNAALLSRAQVLVLNRLGEEALERLLQRAEALMAKPLPLTAEARAALIDMADGDGRYLLNLAEELLMVEGTAALDIEGLTEIVQRVLHFSRPTLAPRRAVAVDEIIRQTLALAGKQLQRNSIRVSTDLEPGLTVTVGPDQIVQVFLNLVINAVEAIDHDGQIDIRAVRDDNFSCITVANDGPPIDHKDLAHLFEPFYTTKTDGTGLGLAVSQTLVEEYGGCIPGSNRDDEAGVVFSVHLPLTGTE